MIPEKPKLPAASMREIQKPSGALPGDEFISAQVADSSLSAARVYPGDVLVCFLTDDVKAGDYVFVETTDGRLHAGRYRPLFHGFFRLEVSGSLLGKTFRPGAARIVGRVCCSQRGGLVVGEADAFRPLH